MAETKLRSCPFCGGEATVYPILFGWRDYEYEVECLKCHCSTDIHKTKQEAIEAWNKRAYHECDESCDYFKGTHGNE